MTETKFDELRALYTEAADKAQEKTAELSEKYNIPWYEMMTLLDLQFYAYNRLIDMHDEFEKEPVKKSFWKRLLRK